MRTPLQIVLGLGQTGLSLVRWLVAEGHSVRVHDTRTQPPGLDQLQQEFPQVEFVGGVLAADSLLQCARILISPGLSRQQPAVQAALAAGIPVIGDVELFASRVQAPVIAITGSNGKSTVTTLVGEVLRMAGIQAVVGGNIGIPVLELLQHPADLYVLELSSFQLESTDSLRPVAATILNLSEDHMDRYEGMADYLTAKQRIYRGAQTAVINRDDWQTELPAGQAVSRLSFGFDVPDAGQFGLRTDASGIQWLAEGTDLLLPVSSLKIQGLHNAANALAALALVRAAGIDPKAGLAALTEFGGLAHRCEWVGSARGAHWYNDSKATNVGATEAALHGLGRNRSKGTRLVLLAGGDGKGADFSSLSHYLANYVDLLLVFGRDAGQLAAICPASVPHQQCETLMDAIEIAAAWVRPEDMVLLSPACASLDQFRNFEHRGQVFAERVTKL